MRILSIDPGISTGWAIVSKGPSNRVWWDLEDFGTYVLARKDSKMIRYNLQGFSQFLDKMEEFPPFDRVLVEDFIFRPDHQRNKWVTLETPKLIGAVADRCHRWNIPCIERQPSQRSIGEKLSGLSRTSDSDPSRHWKDAANHAVSYIHENRYSANKTQ